MADRVHELPNDQLRAKLAGGELSDKKLLPRVRLSAGADESVFKHGFSATRGWERFLQQLDSVALSLSVRVRIQIGELRRVGEHSLLPWHQCVAFEPNVVAIHRLCR
jgi:hypothetical protein